MIALTLAFASILLAAEPPLPDVVHSLPSTPAAPAWPVGAAPATPPKPAPPAAEDKWVTAFPHVRVNRAQKAVEFDGTVAWDFHNADTPRTELELLVCLPMRDKEHESLVLSQAKGAHVHAALLMIGLEPGTPGRIDFGDDKNPGVKRIAPVGPLVSVSFLYTKEGKERADDPRTWVVDEAWAREVKRTPHPVELPPRFQFVFGGSKVGQMRNEQGEKVNVYNADELGTLIGLCTFGTETIGITRIYSPDSGVDAPNFVSNNPAIPPADTQIRVRIAPASPPLTVQPEEPETPEGPDKKPASGPQTAPAPHP
jgi:hypothetical protein